MLAQKKGNDSANDVIVRWYINASLLNKAMTNNPKSVEALQKLALSHGGASCQT
jgi:hypothetical protein